MTTAKLYLILAAALVLAGGGFGSGWYFNGLRGKAALDDLQKAQATAVATQVEAQLAAAQAQAVNDHAAETQHAADIEKVDDLPPIATPLLVYRTAPTPSCPVSGTALEAGSLPADPHGGAGQPVDRGRAVDVRPAIEALKHRLEIIMADYRQEDREWPK